MVTNNDNSTVKTLPSTISDIVKSSGYKSLKSATLRICNGDKKCFNPMGCHKKGDVCYRLPCNTFKRAIDLAKHYEYKLGIPAGDVLTKWEEERGSGRSITSFYGDIPRIDGDNVLLVNSKEEWDIIRQHGFRCPMCGGVSNNPVECDTGCNMPGTDKVCDWKAYGLFGTLGKGVTVVNGNSMLHGSIFKPIIMENDSAV